MRYIGTWLAGDNTKEFAFNKKELRDSLRKEFVIADDDDRSNTDEEPRKSTATTSPTPATRSKTGNATPYAFICFICNDIRETDSTHKLEMIN